MRRDDDDLDEDTEAEAEAPAKGRGGSFAAGIAIGALLGAAVALLLAPASGSVTRKRLGRKLEHAKELAGDELESLSRRAKREIRRRVDAVEKSLS